MSVTVENCTPIEQIPDIMSEESNESGNERPVTVNRDRNGRIVAEEIEDVAGNVFVQVTPISASISRIHVPIIEVEENSNVYYLSAASVIAAESGALHDMYNKNRRTRILDMAGRSRPTRTIRRTRRARGRGGRVLYRMVEEEVIEDDLESPVQVLPQGFSIRDIIGQQMSY